MKNLRIVLFLAALISGVSLTAAQSLATSTLYIPLLSISSLSGQPTIKQVTVLDSTGFSRNGNYIIAGELFNGLLEPVDHIRLNFTYYARNNQVLRSEQQDVGSFIRTFSNNTTPFRYSVQEPLDPNNPLRRVEYYSISVDGYLPPSTNTTWYSLEVLGQDIATSSTNMEVTGFVHNLSNQTLQPSSVTATFYDSEGRVIDTALGAIFGPMLAGDQSPYRVTIGRVFDYHSVRVQAQGYTQSTLPYPAP